MRVILLTLSGGGTFRKHAAQLITHDETFERASVEERKRDQTVPQRLLRCGRRF